MVDGGIMVSHRFKSGGYIISDILLNGRYSYNLLTEPTERGLTGPILIYIIQ